MIERGIRHLLIEAQTLSSDKIQHLSAQTQILIIVALIAALAHVLRAWLWPEHAPGPLIGSRSLLEPRWLLGLRFTSHGRMFLREGYEKYKNDIFRVQCNTIEIVLLPRKYVDELRSLPEEKLSSPQALFNKSNGPYTGLGIILESHLHFQAVQQHLTSNIANFLPLVKKELDFARQQELPACSHDWVPLEVHAKMARIITRISSRIFAGEALARNDEWITISTTYPMNSFATTLALRMVPKPIHPLVAMIVPHYWRAQTNISDAKRIVGRIIDERRRTGIGESVDKDEPMDLLQWMMNEASGPHSRPDKLAHRLLFVSKASVMTTSLLISHCLFDLCAHPQYLNAVREDVLAVLREDGGFQKTTLGKMRKLDSALKESQRLNPAFLMTFDRIVKEPLTLSDGIMLPTGTHIAMPTDPMLRDADLLPPGAHSDSFDPFRYSRAREDSSKPANAQRFQLASTESTSLPFGHGKHACPGRFFASSEAKLILTHLLLQYDFRYPEGKGRPDNWLFAENLAPDPNARLLIRERTMAERDLKMLKTQQ